MRARHHLQLLSLCATLVGSGCATNIRLARPKAPATARFSEFDGIVMKHLVVSPQFEDSGSNRKAADKIDEHLFNCMSDLFPGLVEDEEAARDGNLLLIEPAVEEMKWVGGGARFWAGAAAGSSAVLIRVLYKDARSQEVIADWEFYKKADPRAGAWTVGATDNAMLAYVSDDICRYTLRNL